MAKTKPTLRECGDRVGITRQMVGRFAKKGAPVDSIDNFAKWYAANVDGRKSRRKGEGTPAEQASGGGTTLADEAREKIRLDNELRRVKLARERRQLVESKAVRDWLEKFAGLMRGFGEKLEKRCPDLRPDLDGVLDQAAAMLEEVCGDPQGG